MENKLKRIFVADYGERMKALHPDAVKFAGFVEQPFVVGGPDRFQKPTERPNGGAIPAWTVANFSRERTIASTYKGILCHKPPVDMHLYSSLIWELQPKTIIEFGSLHGGSALWFADQMDAMCGEDGEVHSFDIWPELVSERAKHRRIHFRMADLNDIEKNLDRGYFEALPHPWIIVEDAHTNPIELLCFMHPLMKSGDYYIKEDLDHLGTVADISAGMKVAEDLGLLVDTLFTDAFGLNHTTAVNAWWVKP